MSDDALKDAKLKALEEQVAQNQLLIRSLSGQVRARQLQSQEQFDQNAQLRTSVLLLESDNIQNQQTVHNLSERVKVLEKEKADLEANASQHKKKSEK